MNREPYWLGREIILSIQDELLNRFGGLSGIRDEGLLESALARPEQLFHYGRPTVFELAASYSMGLVKNHPFLDGNKRIGFMAAYTFLGANDWELDAPEEEAVERTLALAAGAIGETEYAAWLERSSVPLPGSDSGT
ncbi:MAG: type II toxin-antitoxin system death-on-curing family toxin [Verrucomicrobiae bacterium]|nr:type II toxin-antitoxin system death-on-curing family toxin [Verrucomicrobiae bacterium]MCP5550220.1 type II toxin-antitoxin system death-on-curing family toxin [Akkermansiaceae bacterium]